MTIFKIVLIFLTIRIIILIVGHLYIVFFKEANELVVRKILENPQEYVRTDHMCKSMDDMVWFYIFVQLLLSVFSGNLIIFK